LLYEVLHVSLKTRNRQALSGLVYFSQKGLPWPQIKPNGLICSAKVKIIPGALASIKLNTIY
jgi:hypothetical protein